MRFFRHYLLSTFFIVSCSFAYAQGTVIVTWKSAAEKISEGVYKVKFTGAVKKGWHVYPLPDTETELSGLTTASDDSAVVTGDLILQTGGTTLPDPVFSKKLAIVTDSLVFTQTIRISGPVPAVIALQVNYEVADAASFYPESVTVKINTGATTAKAPTNRILIPSIDIEHPISNCKTSSSESTAQTGSTNLFTVFLIGFVGGLASLLLPCLFPMIPLTVSFFTHKAGSRRRGILNAFLYGFFIFLIYVGITVPFHLFEKLNPAIFNNISTNVYLNTAFFAIFIFFALSFFGLYEINLPSGISNKADSKSSHQSIWGIFFMALTLTIVSFSCTGPVAGSLLAGVVTGEGGAMRLSIGMGGFGVAIGLPFALFALFPNMLKTLPKSGVG
ncbi:MAG: cytochrome c biogenesis protein CcdA [Ferruginibacter sp.]